MIATSPMNNEAAKRLADFLLRDEKIVVIVRPVSEQESIVQCEEVSVKVGVEGENLEQA